MLILEPTIWPALLYADPQQAYAAPEVTKIEPPNWWVGLTPEVLVVLSGHGLEATHVSCNLPSLHVARTEATARGDYLFVWLKIGPETRSGTAVCRIQTATGAVSFELPLAGRSDSRGKFQGLSPGEALHFIALRPSADNLRKIREQLIEVNNSGATALRLSVESRDTADPFRGVVDFYAIDSDIGSLKDFQELVGSAHAHKMKVVLDLDLFSVGKHHPWVPKPPFAEWLSAAANHDSVSSKLPEGSALFNHMLNTENPLVALYLLQNSIWWVETAGLDGVYVTRNTSVTDSFWRGWRTNLQKIYPRLAIISE